MSSLPKTKMAAEIAEIPEMLARQIDTGLDDYLAAGRDLASCDLRGFVTCARGTSDNAATFLKYVIEIRAGLPVASIGPSAGSVYDAPLRLGDFACLTFSQSGTSPDIVALQEAAARGGARTIAFLNETGSRAGAGAETVLPLHAGPERAVAATKSFVAMLFASLGLAAGLLRDKSLEDDLRSLPEPMAGALQDDWPLAGFAVVRPASLYCIGRGPGLAVAAEAALKFKETCRIHAESCSAAEILHGPVVLAGTGLAALLFDAEDEAKASVRAALKRLCERGARTFLVSSDASEETRLPVPRCGNPLLVPLLQIVGFYRFVEALSRELGEDPDRPEGLAKVTETT